MKKDKTSKVGDVVVSGVDEPTTPAKDKRRKVLGKAATQLCAVFGVDPTNLQGRPVADPTSPKSLAHNGLRKFAIGAIAQLALEVEDAWALAHGADAKPARATQLVPQLDGTHRGTLKSFHNQFLALCGMGDHNAKAACALGKFVRARYEEIRDAALAGIVA